MAAKRHYRRAALDGIFADCLFVLAALLAIGLLRDGAAIVGMMLELLT